MLVKDLMTHPVITVTEETTVGEALDLLKRKNISHLPVVDVNHHLLGVTSEVDLLRVFPKNKSLSNFEANLLSRTPVNSVMTECTINVEADDMVEHAALIMRNNKIGSLPVLEDKKLVGLISRSDIIDAFISSLGFGEPGTRVSIAYKRKWGFLANLIAFVDKFGVIIDNVVTFEKEVVLKVKDPHPDNFIRELKNAGYQVTDVTHMQTVPEQKIMP
jgi:acetoin utilization protein AcuB